MTPTEILPYQPFVVSLYSVMGWGVKLVPGYPTPALIESGIADAYQHPETGFWRLRDDKYDAPGTEYTRVRVVRNPNLEAAWRY